MAVKVSGAKGTLIVTSTQTATRRKDWFQKKTQVRVEEEEANDAPCRGM